MISFILLQAGYFLLSTFILWIMFVSVMSWKKRKEQIPKWLLYPLYGIVAIGLVVDVLFNLVYGTIMFMQWPSYKRLTLTARLKHIIDFQPKDSRRFKLAIFLCKYLIEPWDAGHCRI